MGHTRWDPKDWDRYSRSTATKAADAIFVTKKLSPEMDPTKFEVRESRDSTLNPLSTPVIIGVDVTGSMGRLADYFVKKGLGIFFQETIDRKPVTDPHLMVMGIGDCIYDQAPIQVSQFEADLTIAKWLEQIFIEKCGGGNNFESYDLPYYIAAYKTSTDSWEKRNKKGYLFTLGDEMPPTKTSVADIKKFIGDAPQSDVIFKELIDKAQQQYNCYHIIIAEGNFARSNLSKVKDAWVDLLGQNVIVLDDHTKLSEVLVSIMEINEGKDVDEVVSSWSGDTSLVVKSATQSLTKSNVDDLDVTFL